MASEDVEFVKLQNYQIEYSENNSQASGSDVKQDVVKPECVPLPVAVKADNGSESNHCRGFVKTFLPLLFTMFCLKTTVGRFRCYSLSSIHTQLTDFVQGRKYERR